MQRHEYLSRQIIGTTNRKAHLHDGKIRQLASHVRGSLTILIVRKAAHISSSLDEPTLGQSLL
jgi:hypothetical protein